MTKILTMDDPWWGLRKDLFGNVEPEVKLEGITTPIDYNPLDEVFYLNGGGAVPFNEEWHSCVNMKSVETLPAEAAGTSYGSKDKLEGDPERAIKLNKNLVKMGHHTPLEIVTYVFNISGISKACGAQLSRYRHTGHVSASRRYQKQKAAFVYPMLRDIKDEYTAETRLKSIESIYRQSFDLYEHLRTDFPSNSSGLFSISKQDARMIIPVGSSTERTWWCNARELRHIFSQRIDKTAEPEIRRLCIMLYNIVIQITPSLFEDLDFSL